MHQIHLHSELIPTATVQRTRIKIVTSSMVRFAGNCSVHLPQGCAGSSPTDWISSSGRRVTFPSVRRVTAPQPTSKSRKPMCTELSPVSVGDRKYSCRAPNTRKCKHSSQKRVQTAATKTGTSHALQWTRARSCSTVKVERESSDDVQSRTPLQTMCAPGSTALFPA